jgi:Protein of unknown function (DUF2905)
LGRLLIGIGLALVVAGLLWPWLGRLGLGRLPGDIVVERGELRLYFPIIIADAVAPRPLKAAAFALKGSRPNPGGGDRVADLDQCPGRS